MWWIWGNNCSFVVGLPSTCSTSYLLCHNLVAKMVHWHLSKIFFSTCIVALLVYWSSTISSWKHISQDFVGLLRQLSPQPLSWHCLVWLWSEIYLSFGIQLILIFEKKENEKLHKYQPLANDFHSLYNMPVQIIPIVIGHSGVMASRCWEFLQRIPQFTTGLICHLQKAALLGTIHILHNINL